MVAPAAPACATRSWRVSATSGPALVVRNGRTVPGSDTRSFSTNELRKAASPVSAPSTMPSSGESAAAAAAVMRPMVARSSRASTACTSSSREAKER